MMFFLQQVTTCHMFVFSPQSCNMGGERGQTSEGFGEWQQSAQLFMSDTVEPAKWRDFQPYSCSVSPGDGREFGRKSNITASDSFNTKPSPKILPHASLSGSVSFPAISLLTSVSILPSLPARSYCNPQRVMVLGFHGVWLHVTYSLWIRLYLGPLQIKCLAAKITFYTTSGSLGLTALHAKKTTQLTQITKSYLITLSHPCICR